MAFGQDFLKGFFGNDYLKDYSHASKTYRSAGYELAPRFKFLYHVYFNLNTAQIPTLKNEFDTTKQDQLGLLCKQVDLPKYDVDTDTLIQYNRKRNIQTRINYQPVRVVMHDDSADLSRKLWYNYYSYYYKDPSQKYNGTPNSQGTAGPMTTPTGFDYNERNIYKNNLAVNDWGYIGEAYSDSTQSTSGKPAFFKDITIYGFSHKQFYSYTLINPIITAFEHDTYDYSEDAGLMSNTMTIQYETVKYGSGTIGSGQVPGFGNPSHYDTEPSPIATGGSTTSVLGQGGLVDAGTGVFNDLASGNFLGAIQKGGAIANNPRLNSVNDIAGVLRNEVKDNAVNYLRSDAASQQISNGIKTLTPPTTNAKKVDVDSLLNFISGNE